MSAKKYIIFTLCIFFRLSLFSQHYDSLFVFDKNHWDITNGWFGDDSIVLIPREQADTSMWYQLTNKEIYTKYLILRSPNIDTLELQKMSRINLYRLYVRLIGIHDYGDHLYRVNGLFTYKNKLSCATGEIEKKIIYLKLKEGHFYIKYTLSKYESGVSVEYENVYDIIEWNEKRIIITLCRKE